MEIYRVLFGRRLKLARERAGLKQGQLAELLKVEPPTVSRWENGHDFPEDYRLPLLYSALNVSAEYFTGEEPNRPSPRDLKRLIEGERDELPYLPLRQILEQFARAAPEIRASTLAVLYGDSSIARGYLPEKAQGKPKKS